MRRAHHWLIHTNKTFLCALASHITLGCSLLCSTDLTTAPAKTHANETPSSHDPPHPGMVDWRLAADDHPWIPCVGWSWSSACRLERHLSGRSWWASLSADSRQAVHLRRTLVPCCRRSRGRQWQVSCGRRGSVLSAVCRGRHCRADARTEPRWWCTWRSWTSWYKPSRSCSLGYSRTICRRQSTRCKQIGSRRKWPDSPLHLLGTASGRMKRQPSAAASWSVERWC